MPITATSNKESNKEDKKDFLHTFDNSAFSAMKDNMLKEIISMDAECDRERITWFWNALCNGYFDTNSLNTSTQ